MKSVVKNIKKNGFSLTEVLLGMGILAVGMLFIAGVFPVGLHYSTVSTERTTAAVVADEAFAKIRLYGLDFSALSGAVPAPITFSFDTNDICCVARFPRLWDGFVWRQYEFYYPSTDVASTHTWSALCRRIGPKDVQVTVFVCRYLGPNALYYRRFPAWQQAPYSPYVLDPRRCAHPVPVFVNVRRPSTYYDRLYLRFESYDFQDIVRGFINDGCTIVDDETGRIYRILKRLADNPGTPMEREDEIIQLDRDFEQGPAFINNSYQGRVWVIPPPVGGGKSPCVAVYQKVLRF